MDNLDAETENLYTTDMDRYDTLLTSIAAQMASIDTRLTSLTKEVEWVKTILIGACGFAGTLLTAWIVRHF